MMVEILDPGVQAEKRLRPFPPLESKLLSLLTSCGTMRLFDHVVTSGRGDDLLMVNFSQACDLSNRGPVACELVRANPVWDIIFTQEPGQEGLCGVGIPVPLTKPCSSTALHNQCRTPSTLVHTSSRCHREPRRGSR